MPAITKDFFVDKIGNRFPSEAIDFVYDLFSNGHFSLKVSPPRVSKKGDFRYHVQGQKIPLITVNADLCRYEFLLVFIHEVAHYNVFIKYKIQDVRSHGAEWKGEYLLLLQQLLGNCTLPDDIRQAFVKHGQNVKSSSAMDQHLEDVFQKYRTQHKDTTSLSKLKVGDKFILRHELFVVNEFLRTRAICTNMRTKRRFYVQGCTAVIQIETM
ncbi:MAG: SprT-like domain-containing protein [Bacteroidales bacterium]|jgi:hypothetical protein|nr:SprT-like domain-containing protein [Bacteroidales bacterium]